MTFILSAQLDSESDGSMKCWERYQRYLQTHQRSFPPGAYALATSDWYFNSRDHRAPHDAWLESASLFESAAGARNEERTLSLRIKLLGAYHDHWIELFYPRVFSYSLTHPVSTLGHCDWRYDEFRLSDEGKLIHEIEWMGSLRARTSWVVEADDVVFSTTPRSVD